MHFIICARERERERERERVMGQNVNDVTEDVCEKMNSKQQTIIKVLWNVIDWCRTEWFLEVAELQREREREKQKQ